MQLALYHYQNEISKAVCFKRASYEMAINNHATYTSSNEPRRKRECLALCPCSERILSNIDTYSSSFVPLSEWNRQSSAFQTEKIRDGQHKTTMPLTQVAMNHAERECAW